MTSQPADTPLLTGLSAFPITPQKAFGVIDEAGLTSLVDRLVDAGVDSIGLLGSTGTYAFLNRDQRRRAVQVAAEAIKRKASRPNAANENQVKKPALLVGVGHIRTDMAILLAQDALEHGADAGLLSPVSYNPLTDEEVFQHFRAVAEAVPDLPLVIYNNAGTTKFTFSPELVGRLACIGIAGLKYPSPPTEKDADAVLDSFRGAVTAATATTTDPGVATPVSRFCFGFSRDACIVNGLLAGGQAWFSVFGGLFPRRALQLIRLTRRGPARNDDEARRVHAELQPLWDAMTVHGSLRVAYCVANVCGLSDAQLPRPLLPLAGKDLEAVKQALVQAKLFSESEGITDGDSVASSS